MSIKNNLKKIRTNRDLTQKGLAELANIELAQISRIETGTSEPKLESIKKLAIALKCSSDELIFDIDEQEGSQKLRMIMSKVERLTPVAKATAIDMLNTYCDAKLEHLKIISQAMNDPEKFKKEYGIEAEFAVHMAVDEEERIRKNETIEAIKLVDQASGGSLIIKE